MLVQHRDRTVDKRELLELVWPRLVVEENNLQVQIRPCAKMLIAGSIASAGPDRQWKQETPLKARGRGTSTSLTTQAGAVRRLS